ncbi:MAG: transaldolase, partial [Bacteroidales bacterium]
MNPLQALHAAGQSIWLDYIRRHLLMSGELRRLIEDDALTGMTSNPTLFEKAIVGSADYDEALRAALATNPRASAVELYERLAIEDIQMAADALRRVWDRESGQDGFVSLEVPAGLARDAAATIAEARRLFHAVDRPNVMIKVPATQESLAAIEELTSDGINVNITLIFSARQYEAVAQAYLRGIARCADPRRVCSVASFFVSRVDTKVDQALDRLGTDQALALRGRIAVANAKIAYERFKALFLGPEFETLRGKGARVQRPLWASTGTKDPKYRDVKYVEELIGPDTVNTMPPATLDAFRDHGHVQPTLEEGVEDARRQIAELGRLGIDLDHVADQLQQEGLDSFDKSFGQLLQSLDAKREALPGTPVDRQTFALGGVQPRVTARVDAWTREHVAGRFWHKDPTLWGPRGTPELSDRLGWLTAHEG